MKIKDIIIELKSICSETGIRPDDNTLLEVAEKIYVNNKINESKKENIKSMKESSISTRLEPEKDDFKRATDKQMTYLISLGYTGDIQNLSSNRANILIKSLKGGKNATRKT